MLPVHSLHPAFVLYNNCWQTGESANGRGLCVRSSDAGIALISCCSQDAVTQLQTGRCYECAGWTFLERQTHVDSSVAFSFAMLPPVRF
jgi:hypothetical protein